MKRILLIITLFIALLMQGQDYEYIKSLNTLTKEQARTFADRIAASGQTQWEYVRDEENTYNSKLYIVYAEKGNRETKLRVIYSTNGDILHFSGVQASYDDLFKIWQSVFNPKADYEEAKYEYKMRVYKSAPLDFRFDKITPEIWAIKNYS